VLTAIFFCRCASSTDTDFLAAHEQLQHTLTSLPLKIVRANVEERHRVAAVVSTLTRSCQVEVDALDVCLLCVCCVSAVSLLWVCCGSAVML
jgi:hypothetical protein